jgi:hypothetical protein
MLCAPLHYRVLIAQNRTVVRATDGLSLEFNPVIRNLFYGYTQSGHKPRKGITCPIPEEPDYYYAMF